MTRLPNFRARLLEASIILSKLVRVRASEEIVRIKAEARQLFGDQEGMLVLDAIANPPSIPSSTPS